MMEIAVRNVDVGVLDGKFCGPYLRRLLTPPTLKSVAKTCRKADMVFVSRDNALGLLLVSKAKTKRES